MRLALTMRSSAGSRPLLWAALLSVALHAVLLFGYGRAHSVSSVLMVAPAFQTRLVAAAQTPVSAVATLQTVDAVVVAAAAPPPQTRAPAPNSEGIVVPPAAPATPVPAQPGVQPGLPPAPSYHETKGLDPPPRPLQSIDPEYPEGAGLQEGSVVLRLLISSSGDVDEVAVVRATPKGVFDQSALNAFGKAKFSPGYFLGIPVRSQLYVEVGYTPINRGGAVSGQSR